MSAAFNAVARRAQRIEATGKQIDDKTLMKLVEAKTPSGETHHLVRGIHAIPKWVESTARLRTVFEAGPAIHALERAIEDAASMPDDRARRLLVRRLRTALAYCELAYQTASGGFQVPVEVPKVRIV